MAGGGPLAKRAPSPTERVVGTAGHVDHGKSSLVHALTGTDPDRLAEEKRRGMTLDLGFAEWHLPGGRRCGVVDVPGHQRLVRTMVAGAQAIDLVLLVVAADEGVMPQTREHVVICDLLGIERAVVALTKCDLADEEMRAIAAEETAELLAATPLQGAPIVACSARTGEGLARLAAAVEAGLDELPDRARRGCPRLFVDRVFSVPGFGPVVTGTLESGSLHVGEEVVVLPGGEAARVRSLERHGRSVAGADPGGRTAVNLAGIDRERIRRGAAVAAPGTFRTSRRLDAWLRCPAGSPGGLRHGASLTVHLGTARAIARLWLAAADEVGPGEEGGSQLRLETPLVAAPGDRVVLRRPSPAETLGGGEVLDTGPHRHRRHDGAVVAAMRRRRGASLATLVAEELARAPRGLTLEALVLACGAGRDLVAAALAGLGHEAVELGGRHLALARYGELRARALGLLGEHHAAHPLEAGLGLSAWRRRLGLPARPADALAARLVAAGEVIRAGEALALAGRGSGLDAGASAAADAVIALLDARGLDPPGADELGRAGLSPALARRLLAEGRLVALAPGLLLTARTYARSRALVVHHLEARGGASVAELRDALGATRRVVVPLLERLDADRVTLREGDRRRLRSGPR